MRFAASDDRHFGGFCRAFRLTISGEAV